LKTPQPLTSGAANPLEVPVSDHEDANREDDDLNGLPVRTDVRNGSTERGTDGCEEHNDTFLFWLRIGDGMSPKVGNAYQTAAQKITKVRITGSGVNGHTADQNSDHVRDGSDTRTNGATISPQSPPQRNVPASG